MWQTLDFWFLGLQYMGVKWESTIPDIKNVEKVFSGVLRLRHVRQQHRDR
ncbi:hypothetical protein HDF14_002133 [Edaphobacter lichenicola]|uniref:Uncharacterized protein n=1 Tax=Tunturiibacter gelidiferens TaxID=3069689 RepID=A0A9X0U3P3_9BACT|nr:hypothetical protein [Edaphobacter lichenicola]